MTGRHWTGRKRVPFIPQMETVECGCACLAMVLASHCHHAPLAEVRLACSVGRDGTSAAAIRRAAIGYGFEVEAVRAAVDALPELPLPAILHWGFNHFVVLESCGRRGAILIDPASGRRRVAAKELADWFTGVALTFVPGAAFNPRPARRPSMEPYRALLGHALPVIGQVIGLTALLVILACLSAMSLPFLIDQVLLPRRSSWLVGLTVALASAWLGRNLASLVRRFLLQGLQAHLDLQLRRRFLAHLAYLPLAFFLQRHAGNLMHRTNSLDWIRFQFTSHAVSVLLDAIQLLAFGSLMVAMAPVLGLCLLALSLVRVALAVGLRRPCGQLMAEELAASGKEQAVLMECISAMEVLKSSQSEDRLLERWTRRMVERLNAGFRRRRLEAGLGAGMGVLQAISMACVLWLGGRAVMAERMTPGDLAAFLTIQALVGAPLQSLLAAYTQLQYLGYHLLRVDDILTHPVERRDGADPGRLLGAVDLEEVSFRYSAGSPWAVAEVSLQVRPGEKIALVGPSGSGKTTLAHLILALHQPEKGCICFDGHPLETLDPASLRRQMGVVLQDTFLFDDTVRANLSLHDPDLPLVALRRAASLACFLEVIETLPLGFDTRVGDNGHRLSGGERQRLSLARALAHDPSILLLDEATSALDLATELRLHANLATLGCTRLVIAHRMATVKDADRVIVLDRGRIVQQGSYQVLAARQGLFRDLLRASRHET